MKLLTKDILEKLPPLYSQEDVADPMVWVKFFTPDSGWTWLATEYSPEERLFFGFVVSGIDPSLSELGYFNLDELEEARGPLGLPIERDMYFKAKPLSQAKAEEMGSLGNEGAVEEDEKDIPCHICGGPAVFNPTRETPTDQIGEMCDECDEWTCQGCMADENVCKECAEEMGGGREASREFRQREAATEKKGVKYDASDDLNNLMKLADQLGVAVGEPFDLLDQLHNSANAIFDRLYDTSPAQVKLMDMTSVGGNLGAAWKEADLLMGTITDSLSTIQFRTSAAMRNYDWFREEQGKRYKRPGPEASKQSIDEWDPETRILKMGATTPEGGPEPGLGAAEAMRKQAEDDANEPLKSHGQPEGLAFDWTYDVDSYNYPAFEDDPEGDKDIYGRNFNDSDEFEEYLGYSPIDEIIKACKPGLYGGYTYDEHGLGTLGWQTPVVMILDMERLEGATDKNGDGLVTNDGMRWRVWLNGDTIDEGEGFMDKSEVIDYVKEHKADAYGNLPGDEDYNGVGQGRYSEDNLIEEGPGSGIEAVEAMKKEAIQMEDEKGPYIIYFEVAGHFAPGTPREEQLAVQHGALKYAEACEVDYADFISAHSDNYNDADNVLGVFARAEEILPVNNVGVYAWMKIEETDELNEVFGIEGGQAGDYDTLGEMFDSAVVEEKLDEWLPGHQPIQSREGSRVEAEKKVTVALPDGSFAEFPELWGRMTYPGETPQTCGDCGWEGEVEETQIPNIDEDGQWDGQFSCPGCGSGNLEYPDDAEWTQTAVLKAFDEGFLSFKERY